MEAEEELRDLLCKTADKEKRAYRRAIVYTALPVLVGIIWLSYSATRVFNLNRQRRDLVGEIQTRKIELDKINVAIESAKGSLTSKGDCEQQAQQALTTLSEAQRIVKTQKGVDQENTNKNQSLTSVGSKTSIVATSESTKDQQLVDISRAISNLVQAANFSYIIDHKMANKTQIIRDVYSMPKMAIENCSTLKITQDWTRTMIDGSTKTITPVSRRWVIDLKDMALDVEIAQVATLNGETGEEFGLYVL